jgi:hypothetical protein
MHPTSRFRPLSRRGFVSGIACVAAPALLIPKIVRASNPPNILDLRDLLDARYGVGLWTQRTGTGVGTDIGPAICDGLTTLKSQFFGGKIFIPPGIWLLNTPIPASLLSGSIIYGLHSQASIIVFNNAGNAAFSFNGSGGATGGGMHGLGILLESGLGNTNSYAILLSGDTVRQQDQTEWRDLYITAWGGSSYWWDAFHIDGTARSHPQGVRVGTMDNVQLFNCRNLPCYIGNAVQWTLSNVGAYTSIGPYGNTIMIGGGTTHLYGTGINATLNMGSTLDVMINGIRYS